MKTRFAPSPTGNIHMGNARTALFSYLLAVGHEGHFLLRIEDTDVARSEKIYEQGLMQDLKWLGLMWHEGPEVGGEKGPYHQALRNDIYSDYYQKLIDLGHAYHCFCSEAHLAVTRKVQLAAGQAPRYPGTCRHLTEAEREEKRAQGIAPTLRFKVPKGEVISFEDGVKGLQKFAAEDIGDFIIRRADGGSSFMFCNAIDDSLMGVTHVMRGEDHLTNTPRQLMILEALGMQKPSYAHISMILGSDGAPLSKRNGSRSIQQLREEGFLALAVVNYMARLGHYYEHNELLPLKELSKQFKWESLGKSAARFDESQLLYWQKTAVLALGEAELGEWLANAMTQVPLESHKEFMAVVRDNILFPHEASAWAERLFGELSMEAEAAQLLQGVDSQLFVLAAAAIDQHGADFKAMADAISTALGIKGKALFQPLRAALTGQMHGPNMGPLVALMGASRAKSRLLAQANR